MIKEKWYSYAAIRFTKSQIIFVLENIYTMREGIWPSNPKDSGYIDTTVVNRPQYTKGAGFERACEIGAEVWVRLQACRAGGAKFNNGNYRSGVDGELLEFQSTWGRSDEDLSREYGMSEVDVRARIATALRYCSGKDRRPYSYAEYKRRR